MLPMSEWRILPEKVKVIQPRGMRAGLGPRPPIETIYPGSTIHATPAEGGSGDTACGLSFSTIVRLAPPNDWDTHINPALKVTRCPACVAVAGPGEQAG
jgi:hypothetical protein